jgi:hypothetical protein
MGFLLLRFQGFKPFKHFPVLSVRSLSLFIFVRISAFMRLCNTLENMLHGKSPAKDKRRAVGTIKFGVSKYEKHRINKFASSRIKIQTRGQQADGTGKGGILEQIQKQSWRSDD